MIRKKAKRLGFPGLLILLCGLLLGGVFLFSTKIISGHEKNEKNVLILWPYEKAGKYCEFTKFFIRCLPEEQHVNSKDDEGYPNLQLRSFVFVTLAPPPIIPTPTNAPPLITTPPRTAAPPPVVPSGPGGPWCPADSIKPAGQSCRCSDALAIACPASNGQQSKCPHGQLIIPIPPGTNTWYCVTITNQTEISGPSSTTAPPGCLLACLAKPVIYLYPTEPTVIDVAVTSPGRIYISDPLYPEGGWKNVLAYPDGTLFYQGGKYNELYYETEVEYVKPPKTGLVIPTAHLEERLRDVIARLGLRGRESEEFMDYWLPHLYELNAPYILFSVIEPDEKERVDHVDIVPKPDTFINFIAYFKPLNQPFADVPALILPENAPERKGFTAVEWGGTID
jgi:hypothetical protein